jgi:hypothetical protein
MGQLWRALIGGTFCSVLLVWQQALLASVLREQLWIHQKSLLEAL